MTAVVVTDHVFANLDYERAFAASVGQELRTLQCSTEEETMVALKGAAIAFVNFAPITRSVIEQMTEGATVIRYGVGYDNVDIIAAREHGIRVCNVPDYGTSTVADHAVTLALTLLRKITLFNEITAEGGWVNPGQFAPILEFEDTTIGLLGTGRIGLSVAQRLRAFGFTLIAYDPFAQASTLAELSIESVSLDELWERSNLITLHAPATEQTHHIVNAETLKKMPRHSFIVNTARGALVDLGAVADALASEHLAGVGLDVFDEEPLRSNHPLRFDSRAILTPHAAFYSARSMDNLQRLATEEAARAMRGELLRCCVS
jgi:D-3-phosphoglycerate dehydrogenase